MARLKCPKCLHVNPEARDTCVKCGAPLPRIRIEAQAERPPQNAQPPPEIQFRQGQVIAKRYTVLKLVGRGGMGAIYRVHDNILGEEVALKTLLPQLARDKLVVERFFNEARIARRLAHPNIVRVHDIGSTGKAIYISMEYVDGKSLRVAMDHLRSGARMPVLQTLLIMDELCAALEYAHQYTVHRDIKPENVMIQKNGQVKLMDFGISKLMADTRLTGASVIMGTPFYMAPEQLRNSRDVDARADVYSVGVMLYEVLTGNVPTGVPKPLSEILSSVPRELDRIVRRCVEPDPKDRYQNVRELREALAQVRESLEGGAGVARWRPRITTQTTSPGAGRRFAGYATAAAVALGMLFGLYQAEAYRRELPAAAEALDAAAGPAQARTVAEALTPLVERARAVAASRAANPESRLRVALEAGDTAWARARQLHDDGGPDAAIHARHALQCYLATVIWPEHMVFIPPGPTTVGGERVEHVPPFFIDETEVTAGDYRRFCESVEGGWPYLLDEDYPADWPVTWVTYYDAQAYAAWKGAGRNAVRALPTEAQWARAAYGADGPDFPWGESWQDDAARIRGVGDADTPAPVKSHKTDRTEFGCYDMAGNVSEWTRSFFDPEQAETFGNRPGFGAVLTVRGGNFAAGPVPLRDRYEVRFGHRDSTIGFRCVLEIPDDTATAKRLLGRTW